jgi:Cu/Ag efflux protein CusF
MRSPPVTSRPLRSAAALAVLASLAVAAAGCRDREPPERAGDRYTVRGEIVRVPAPGAMPRELSIRHEAIPDFRAADGKVVGMPAMVMPFAVPPTVSLDGLAAGDRIRFRFVVDWASHATEVEAVEKLPPGTALDFGAR